MDRAASLTRPTTRRKPLGDAGQQVNSLPALATTKLPMTSSSHTSGLVHHESLMANGALTVQNATNNKFPENKRLSAITNDDPTDSKRSSQVSTASTTASGRVRRRKTHVGPWELGPDVGKGGSGNVRKVRHCLTGQSAAAKIISKRIAQQVGAESLSNLYESSKKPSLASFKNVMPFGIEREVVILKLLDHPNIVKLYDVWENRSELYLVMEYIDGGELFDFVDQQGHLAEDETVWLLRQMLAALVYCARLGIHHRDLKPENILLHYETRQVKIVDFGMAALQPKGSFLTTPCGSIHYAAPEVFKRRYDGGKIDVWSLGVILYVMLTGTTPFAYDPEVESNMEVWYAMLMAARFPMPESLSKEAKDLIWRMLQPDPRRRISLEGAWNHPLIHKYDREWREEPDATKLEKWVGPSPIIGAWSVKKQDDIDREVLRNLRTLWHSEKEDVLIQKILSPEPNQEKYFYYALQKHRDEQLENYLGTPENMNHSGSDYHHIKSINSPLQQTVISGSKATRSKSQFSILNDEHLSRSSFLEPPPSERSYDPYRASRDHINVGKNTYMNVTVHRDLSMHNRNNSGGQSLRQPASLRIEALRKQQRRMSTTSSAASLKSSSTALKSRVGTTRTLSRSSMGSSLHSSSPPVNFKPSAKHKRPVNFSHLRRSSTASALTSKSFTPSVTPQKPRRLAKHSSPDIRDPLSSPGTYAGVPIEEIGVISKKESKALATPRPRTRRTNTRSQVIDTEARKVSAELGDYCEVVFNRSSGTSSHTTSATLSQNLYETPPSSVSNRGSAQSAQATLTPSASQRPLPEVPAFTPHTVVARELSETRRRLAAYANEQGSANNKPITDVMAQLDSWIGARAADARRTTSMPEQRTSEYLSFLPSIREEGRAGEVDGSRLSKDEKEVRVGSADQLMRLSTARQWEQRPKDTIRMIDPSSPPRPAPLNIRKISSTNPPAFQPTNGNSLQSLSIDDPISQPNSTPGAISTSPKRTNFVSDKTTDERLYESSDAQIQKKKAWWRRNKVPESRDESQKKGDDVDVRVQSPMASEFDRYWRRTSDPRRVSGSKRTPSPAPNISPMSGTLQSPRDRGMVGKRPGFLSFLRRSPKIGQGKGFVAGDEYQEPGTPSTAAFSTSERSSHLTARHGHSLEATEQFAPRDLGVQQSWFARFLHIKPAMRVLCLHITRGRARAEIVRLLKSWRAHGIQDVVNDRERNLVFARLDSVNALGIKEVEFVVELFVVLHSGARKGLSMARFTQRKGAASSLKRVVNEIEARLGSRHYLVDDKVVKKEMESVLAEGQGR